MLQRNTFLILIAIAIAACAGGKKQEATISGESEVKSVAGNYVNADYKEKDKGYDWVGVIVNELLIVWYKFQCGRGLT